MNLLQSLILLVRRSLGEGGNAVKDPATWTQRVFCWILRSAQNDTHRWLKSGFGLLLALSIQLSALRLSAADVTDLGSDLAYLRVHSIVLEREAIAAALLKSRALVLDLRYPADERDAGDILRQELAAPAPKPRLYVLVSPATPVPVVGAIAASPAKLSTLGVKGAKPEPQVVVLQTADDDRRAYDALAAGTPLAELVSGKIEKERFDEASLVQEFKNGLPGDRPGQTPAGQSLDKLGTLSTSNGQTGTVPDPQPPASVTPAGKASDQRERLTDRVLQRALHLHRAFQALKR